MSRIEIFSKIIASKISKNLPIDNDHEEVIAYGAFALIQTLVSILAVAVFGIIFDVLLESLIISFSAATLRKFSGGAHAAAPMSCALIGMIIFGGQAFLVKHFIVSLNFTYLLLIMIAAFVFVFYIMLKYSPVGSVNKPLKKEATRIRLKRQSIKYVIFLLLVNVVLTAIYIKTKNIHLISAASCITIGIVWQSFTLVSLGHLIIETLDKTLRGTILIRRTN